jgi:ribonuclease HI
MSTQYLMKPQYLMQFDGGSRGNPGPSAAGAVLFHHNDEQPNEQIWESSIYLGDSQTNNYAEYHSLILGLEQIFEHLNATVATTVAEPVHVLVQGDSALAINQVNGLWAVRAEHIIPLHRRACELVRNIRNIVPDKITLTLEHIKRNKNKIADALVNRELDSREQTA